IATAAAATAAAAVFAPATATTTRRAVFARASDVDGQGATIQLGAIHRRDGLLGLLGRTHGDKSETARTAAHAVHHQVGFDDRAVRREGVLQIVFRGIEGEVPYKQFTAHVTFNVAVRLSLHSPDCSRPSGLKSSLNKVHLRISMPWKQQGI